jgi:hypothetical protein
LIPVARRAVRSLVVERCRLRLFVFVPVFMAVPSGFLFDIWATARQAPFHTRIGTQSQFLEAISTGIERDGAATARGGCKRPEAPGQARAQIDTTGQIIPRDGTPGP